MPKARSVDEINQDYYRKASTLGHLQWQMDKLPAQIESVKRELRQLDNEADEAQKVEMKKQQTKTAPVAAKDAPVTL